MQRFLWMVLALAALPAHAQLYKWTDANGKVHYSDRPQDGVDVKAVPRAATSGSTGSAGGDDWRERERASRERLVKQQQEERRTAARAAQQANKEPYNPSMHKSDKPMTDDEMCTRDAQQIAYSEKAKRLAFNRANGASSVASEEETREIVRQRKENHALLCGPGQRRR
ncbi:DUF4124 domain-containing protein [Pseudoduganella sp. DS3]|uniref:DUF4124 domain-containing protein n=1 Tax=Pseudoduganella guangdongensis TaxID=2692179 RepID=A0A6N9HFD8_9BURK|nr:DUF4124 domain-containing protein [Pseudoduganella guangdongensis]MYN02254.1 DUF4124 domain-containing protein [Pseudoduganella guangdongensis]